MKEHCGNYFILNGELKPAALFDNSLLYKGDSVYEVLKLEGGIPVFFEDHMERLDSSLKIQNKKPLASGQRLKDDIISLVKSGKMKEINIKIVFNYNDDSENYIICYIESSYPSSEQYMKGVRGILFFAERKDPRAKVFDYQLRASVHRELASEGAYEALLVNENNEITEGSKSNIFFLKDDKLVTAPDHTVLNGITRKHILQICEAEGIKVEFSCIDADNLGEYESVFMTGTSSAVLPFNSINGCHFRTDQPLIGRIRKLYILKAEESIRDFSS